MIFLFRFLFFVCFFIPSFNLFSQPVVYPLHIGDKWKYDKIFPQSFAPSRAEILGDTVMPNNLLYIIKQYDGAFPGGGNTRFERQDGKQIFCYYPPLHDEYLWYKFDTLSNDTINKIPWGNENPDDTIDIVLQQYRIDTLLGNVRRQWIFSINYFRNSYDDVEIIEITDSLGITRLKCQTGESVILGAKIDSLVYGIITDVEEPLPSFPTRHILKQNYPNPFNPTTTIEYELVKNTYVRLDLLNVVGQTVQVFANEFQYQGVHSIVLNAKELSSGTYYYRLLTVQGTEIKPLTIIK